MGVAKTGKWYRILPCTWIGSEKDEKTMFTDVHAGM